MKQVQVPKDFFVKERRMYSQWQFAFWRELFQNAIDAGSTQIQIKLSSQDNVISVVFDDNGHGMTREILESVYFCLGASSKSGGTVGGFGRARIITCFSMKSYKIATQNNLVVGDGAYYEIHKNPEYKKGCRLDIEMQDEDIENLKTNLNLYLGMSQLDCDVTINDERWRLWSHRRQMTRRLSLNNQEFASVYVNKSAKNSRVLVRVNGTVMFYRMNRSLVQVIIEIDADKSREVLTANRDGMQSSYANVLDDFLSELAVDTTSALKPRYRSKSETIRCNGFIISAKKKDSANTKNNTNETVAVPSVLVPENLEVLKELQRAVESSQNKISDEHTESTISSTLDDLPDIYLIDESTNPEVRKVIDSYNPKNWGVVQTATGSYRKGGNIRKLLNLWKIACQQSIEALRKAKPDFVETLNWSIGWIFTEDAYARCQSVDDGFVFLLNPVDEKGCLLYSVRDKESFKKILAFAKHEVAHIVHTYHDESYARLLTLIDAYSDEKETFAMFKESLALANR